MVYTLQDHIFMVEMETQRGRCRMPAFAGGPDSWWWFSLWWNNSGRSDSSWLVGNEDLTAKNNVS